MLIYILDDIIITIFITFVKPILSYVFLHLIMTNPVSSSYKYSFIRAYIDILL